MTDDRSAVEAPEQAQEALEAADPSAATPDAPEAAEGAREAPEDFKPEPTELVVRDREDVFRVMDKADEEQILDELQGNLLKTMIYSFGSGGSKVTDLSYAGVLEAIRQLNAHGHRIRVAGEPRPDLQEIVEDDDSYFRAIVYAVDERTGMGQFGLAKQAKHKKVKGKQERDPFAETIALNKAQRNALRPFVPEKWRQALIAQYHGDAGAEKRLRAGTAPSADLPPPLTDERAQQQTAEARLIYDNIKATAGRLWLPPGEFAAHLNRVAHDHDRLDDFIEYLRGKLEKAKAEHDGS